MISKLWQYRSCQGQQEKGSALVKANGKTGALIYCRHHWCISYGGRIASTCLNRKHIYPLIQQSPFGSLYGYTGIHMKWRMFKITHCTIFLSVKRLETIQLSITMELAKSIVMCQYGRMLNNSMLRYRRRGKTTYWYGKTDKSLVKWKIKQGAEQDVECITFCEKQGGKNVYSYVLLFAWRNSEGYSQNSIKQLPF